jgi:site-specific recombinase XerD
MQENSLSLDERLQGNPLELQLRTFATWLTGEGYAKWTVRLKLRLLANLGEWLEQTNRAVTNLDEQLLEAFAEHRERVRWGDLRTLADFLNHLRERNVVPDRKLVPAPSPLAELLSRYEKHLRSERGLMVQTISVYQYFVRKFLEERFPKGALQTKELAASDISAFVLRHSQSWSVGSAGRMMTAFRSFFRYLFQRGELSTDLAASVPAVANRQLSTVPKYISPEEVERVLQACNRHTAVGRRDHAILLLLARLGLRAGEVVALQLEDINWRAGEILVRGKGQLHERMPMPVDVGEALASYLRQDRPPCQTRRVFVRAQAPHRGFAGSQTIGGIVRHVLKRGHVHPASRGAAHLFRHGVATFILRSGATMGEVGEVLRHRHPNTTGIYAKVDFEGLRSLAQPWPLRGAQ